MCGIWSYVKITNNNKKCLLERDMFDMFMKIKHRGPDSTIFENFSNLYIGFHRLAIMDPTFHSNQPYILFDDETDRTIIFLCNGEIYNYKELIMNYNLDIYSNSDCLTIPKLYIKYGIEKFRTLFDTEIKGEFAFTLFEFDNLKKLNNIVYGRDMVGIRPLYTSESDNGIFFCSEIKGVEHGNIREVNPGTINSISFDGIGNINHNNIYNFSHIYDIFVPTNRICEVNEYSTRIKKSVINSIKRRLFSDRPIAFLLSGGVDSSLVASISARLLGSTSKIRTFCCGMEGGTDLIYARKVANHIGSSHTEVIFTPEEAINVVRDVIYTTETWDTTTIRASVGQYLVSKYISENTDAKVLLVGEGPDEVCSSYLFNYYAPSSDDLHKTAIEYVKNIHLYDCRRVDRCSSRWGLECRVPLLDPEFIKEYWTIEPSLRMPQYGGIEKFILRNSFRDDNLLPEDVLFRKKEAFSDGISKKTKSWFEILNEYITTLVAAEDTSSEPSVEAYYYKKVFKEFFGDKNISIIPNYWQPKWIDKDGVVPKNYIDPSARILKVYN